MGETTEISWCHSTFNPWIGCQKVSDGCKQCYASVDHFARVSASRGLPLWGPNSTRHRTSVANWKKPFAWDRKAIDARVDAKVDGVPYERPRVFCASLCDIFEDHPSLDAYRADLWPIIEKCRELDWMLLTKRPQNILRMVPEKWRTDWPRHVWVGTSVENQDAANERIPEMLKVPARIRFLSMEPLLGPVDIARAWGDAIRKSGATARTIDLVIVGGESGPSARPFDLAWARQIRDDARAMRTAYFFKQTGANAVDSDAPDPPGLIRGGPLELRLKDRKGGDLAELPADLRIREMPKGV
jgi:protein gp37